MVGCIVAVWWVADLSCGSIIMLRVNHWSNLRLLTIVHKGGVHILRKTFSTVMYENGARTKEIAAYIGDLESTVERYYIAIRKKRTINGKEEHIVALPKTIKD